LKASQEAEEVIFGESNVFDILFQGRPLSLLRGITEILSSKFLLLVPKKILGGF